jgi:hypothetical protein
MNAIVQKKFEDVERLPQEMQAEAFNFVQFL